MTAKPCLFLFCSLKKFDRRAAKPGDALVLARFRTVRLTFKGMGHDGEVVASWDKPPPNRPIDTILRQCDVLMAETK